MLSIFKAISIFTNYTGETKCNGIEDAAPQLGAFFWSYQACTEMVMPLCTNGITDMFEPSTWSEEKFSESCYKAFKVRPQINRVCKIYGCSDLSAASNIVFRYTYKHKKKKYLLFHRKRYNTLKMRIMNSKLILKFRILKLEYVLVFRVSSKFKSNKYSKFKKKSL